MPTIHVSVPEAVYEQLRRRAEELGIQITDVVRLFIKEGLKGNLGGAARGPAASDEAVEALARKVDALERNIKMQITRLKGKQRELEEFLQYVLERLDMIEDLLGQQRRAALMAGEGEG